MGNEIPKIKFNEGKISNIEVMSFEQLKSKLDNVEKHDPFKAHKIEFHLILIVSDNSYQHFVDFKSYKLRKGDSIFVAKNQVHHFTHALKDAQGIGIVIDSLLMNKYSFLSNTIKLNRLFNYHIGTPTITVEEMGEDSLLDIAELLLKEYHTDDNFTKSEMLRTLFHVLLLRAERTKETCSNVTIKPYWLEVFSKFKSLLEVEYTQTRSSRYYAKKMLVSYKFLNDVVKQVTNKTVKAFIDDYVTTEIKRYLVSTSLSVKEIAYQTGFMEPANMGKFFKNNSKTTPLQFRQSL